MCSAKDIISFSVSWSTQPVHVRQVSDLVSPSYMNVRCVLNAMATSERLSTMRLYGSLIALVSGGYSVYLATTGRGMSASAWLMVVLGVVVLMHGVVLLTPLAVRLGSASGPLMIVYAVLMLLNQAVMASMGSSGMGDGMNGMNSVAAGMGWDAGMVAIALLMLASGAVMTTRHDVMSSQGKMEME